MTPASGPCRVACLFKHASFKWEWDFPSDRKSLHDYIILYKTYQPTTDRDFPTGLQDTNSHVSKRVTWPGTEGSLSLLRATTGREPEGEKTHPNPKRWDLSPSTARNWNWPIPRKLERGPWAFSEITAPADTPHCGLQRVGMTVDQLRPCELPEKAWEVWAPETVWRK